MQDACLNSFTRLEELERIEFPRAWLLKMLYHKFIDKQRADTRSPTSTADTGINSMDPDELTQQESLPGMMLDDDIRTTRILMAMNRLNRDHCALVALRDIEGFSIGELEELTGLPGGTIKAQLHRTRAKLGRMLSNETSLKPSIQAIGGEQ